MNQERPGPAVALGPHSTYTMLFSVCRSVLGHGVVAWLEEVLLVNHPWSTSVWRFERPPDAWLDMHVLDNCRVCGLCSLEVSWTFGPRLGLEVLKPGLDGFGLSGVTKAIDGGLCSCHVSLSPSNDLDDVVSVWEAFRVVAECLRSLRQPNIYSES